MGVGTSTVCKDISAVVVGSVEVVVGKVVVVTGIIVACFTLSLELDYSILNGSFEKLCFLT